MVNFYPGYVSDAVNRWDADRAAEQARFNSPPYAGLFIGQPERAAAALATWEKVHPRPHATLAQVADHIDHVRKVAGVDHVGIGSDFDGIPDGPQGLQSVEDYPALLVELMRRGWTDADVAKVAGENVLRVMETAEQVGSRFGPHELQPTNRVRGWLGDDRAVPWSGVASRLRDPQNALRRRSIGDRSSNTRAQCHGLPGQFLVGREPRRIVELLETHVQVAAALDR